MPTTRRAAAEDWVRGGLRHAFLARFREIDWMRKRMLKVSRRFASVERVQRNGGLCATSQLLKPRRALYRGYVGAPFLEPVAFCVECNFGLATSRSDVASLQFGGAPPLSSAGPARQAFRGVVVLARLEIPARTTRFGFEATLAVDHKRAPCAAPEGGGRDL